MRHYFSGRPASIRSALSFLGVLALCAIVLGCSRDSSAAMQPSAAAPASDDLPDVLATVGAESITLKDVYERRGEDLERMELQYRIARNEVIESALDSLVRERVLSAESQARGQSVAELITTEAGSGSDPSDVDVEAWYQDNRARLGGRSLEQVRTQIADHLREERRDEALKRLQDRLYEERGVKIHLEPVRIEFDNTRAPAIGSENAPVTLVEFSDFQCPFCARLVPALKQVEHEFGDEVRIVYRHFPITSIHPLAFKAAEASVCAQDQGKFWPMHDLIFEEQNRVSLADLKDKARRLGLDQREFDACLDSGRHAELVVHDFEEGQKAGVSGTPATFVNGIRLEAGAVSFEVLADAIRKELARRKQ